jgi:hypothetical protein
LHGCTDFAGMYPLLPPSSKQGEGIVYPPDRMQLCNRYPPFLSGCRRFEETVSHFFLASDAAENIRRRIVVRERKGRIGKS